ncbi:MAG: tetratricopeptide repeat protein [Planctomycetota bacterium]
MSGKKKLETKNSEPKTSKFHSFTSYALCFITLVFTLSFMGCLPPTESDYAPQLNRISQAQSQQRKLRLLKAIERRFENPEAHFELGQLYQAEGLLVSAEYHYSTALRFNPVYRDAQAAMVKMKIENGDIAGGKLQADTYMRQVSTSAAGSRWLAMAFQKQGMDEYTLACYQQSIHLEPNSAETYKQIGYYYLSKDDKVRARDYLSRSFEIKPNQSDVALTLGQLGVEIRMPQKPETIPGQPQESVE